MKARLPYLFAFLLQPEAYRQLKNQPVQPSFKRLLIACCLLCHFSIAFSQQQVAKTVASANSPDGIIGFLEYTPAGYNPNGSELHPLIIFFHGLGAQGNGVSDINNVASSAPGSIAWYCADPSRGNTMTFTVNGQTSSFVVLSPQLSSAFGADMYWRPFYGAEMIAYAKANLKIDPNRIYITGLSLGGGGVWNAAKDASINKSIAAIAPVAAINGFVSDTDPTEFCNTIAANHIPLWAFATKYDPVVPYYPTQKAENFANACGLTPPAIFTYYRDAIGGDAHASTWKNAYDPGHITRTLENNTDVTFNPNLYEWFLQHKLNAPTVGAGNAQTITLPASTASLMGSATFYNGAVAASYQWAKTSGPAGATIANPTQVGTQVTGLVQGVYQFTLTVTDNNGLTGSATVAITVSPATNQPPVSNAGPNATITLPTNTITLDGSASSDNDGSIVAYYWEQLSGPAASTIANNTAVVTSASGLVQGSYVFRLHVRDNSGVVSLSTKTVTVDAAPGNQTPVSNAGPNVTITLPATTVALDASASGSAGLIEAYYWEQLSGPSTAAIANITARVTSASNLVQGSYVFRLHVRDNNHVVTLSSKTVTVNQPPISNAGPNVTITLPTSTVTLDGSGSSDADGSIVAYYWEQLSGPSASSIANNTAIVTTASGLIQGTYVFRLHVRDNSAVVTLSTKTVTVNASGARSVSPAGNTVAIADGGPVPNPVKTLPSLYPNPVKNYAVIELKSADNSLKTIHLYNSTGAIIGRYSWPVVKGLNRYSLQHIPGLQKGLYMVDIRDAAGKNAGILKFIKL